LVTIISKYNKRSIFRKIHHRVKELVIEIIRQLKKISTHLFEKGEDNIPPDEFFRAPVTDFNAFT